jgi:hypothetical protein
MLTTGLGQAHESIPRDPREVEARSRTGEENAAVRAAPLLPTDCPVCGDVPAEPMAVCSDFDCPTTRDAFLALRCSDCGSVYLSPAPDPVDRLPGSTEAGLAAGLSRAGRRLAHRSRGLDATRVLALSQHTDPALDPSRVGRGTLERVILDGTLEYSQAPLALLATLREAIRPGGRVVLILKNLASPSFRVFGGRHWAGYDFPRQRAVYSAEGVRRLAGLTGFEVRSISTASDPACWVESIRRALSDWRAPGWLIRRFESTSVASRAAFGVLEGVLQWRRRGALLVVSLGQAPDAAGAPSPGAGKDFGS